MVWSVTTADLGGNLTVHRTSQHLVVLGEKCEEGESWITDDLVYLITLFRGNVL